MRVLIQRVSKAKVEIDGKISGEIGEGLLVFAGFVEDDNEKDLDWMANKLTNLR
ncbi:MAG: D-tyrosyl-tRNA(Tyr) deacylase, partial [Bacteroidales bacterium]|nr:D-tyrosyl-tRNA(Tyr) deacylase [Bacteroidales bacterium]